MTGRCPNPYCFVDDGGGCHLGHPDPAACAELANAGSDDEARPGVSQEHPGGILFPWSSNALGTVDLSFVAARSQPTMVGLIGPHNAGKTTLLGSLYLQLGAGQRPCATQRFAGSYSLGGWEAVAHGLRWSSDRPPSFPPHTPMGSLRQPGMLHLAFRGADARLIDLFFADAPGEWFDRWAHDRDADDAASARWVADRATVFLLVADCEALAGEDRGNARKTLRFLAERIAESRGGRAAALVWAKADVAPPKAIEVAVRSAVEAVIPGVPEFRVTVAPKAGDEAEFMPLLGWILAAQSQPVDLPPAPPVPKNDPFLAYVR